MRTIDRTCAVADLRAKLMSLVDEDHCMCWVAARLHVFCGGFSQWKSHELKERYPWLLKNRPHLTREQLEDLADSWQLARQFVLDEQICCDAQAREKRFRVCGGWDQFSDDELARFHAELCGEEVHVASE